ncbi:multidrug resistance-associated protein 5 [Tanacetum coccineum]
MGKFRETLAESAEGALHLGPKRDRVFADLTPEEKERFIADIRAMNILLQGLLKDIYTFINHYTDAKDIWDNVKMLIEGSGLTKDERESQFYDEFEHFHQNKGETIHKYYVRFVTAVKLNRGLKQSNYDQLYAYLKQHEAHANENKMMLERYIQHAIDPLALGRQNKGQGNYARGTVAHGNGGVQNRVGNANPGGQANAFDDDVDEAPTPTTQTMFMAILSSADLIYDEAGLSYDSYILSEVQDHDNYVDSVGEIFEEHDIYMNELLKSLKTTDKDGITEDPFISVEKHVERYPMYDETTHWRLRKPKVGEKYTSVAQFKECLTYYALANGFSLWHERSGEERVVAKCGQRPPRVSAPEKGKQRKQTKYPCASSDALPKCPWRCYARWMTAEKTFQCISLVDEHTCVRNFNFGALVNYKWIAKIFGDKIRANPNIRLCDIADLVMKKYKCKVSLNQCVNAKKYALTEYEKSVGEHYSMLRSYGKAILDSNPGSIIKLAGCRKIIALDGCFLKRPNQGEILTAIGRDGNNHIYPVALAVVNVENKDNWTWFLELLEEDLGCSRGNGLTLMSDQHKLLKMSCQMLSTSNMQGIFMKTLGDNTLVEAGGSSGASRSRGRGACGSKGRGVGGSKRKLVSTVGTQKRQGKKKVRTFGFAK